MSRRAILISRMWRNARWAAAIIAVALVFGMVAMFILVKAFPGLPLSLMLQ